MTFAFAEAVAVLERTPAVLDRLLRGIDPAWSRYAPPGEWSAFDVLGHLCFGERTDWIPRARIILEEGPARPFDPFDREGMFAASAGKEPDDLLGDFLALRAQSLAALKAMRIGTAELGARGTHPELGPVTLAQLVAAWAVHDLDHTDQIVATLGRRYREAIGPWRAYLPVVDRIAP